jgi:uncharacterized protein (TIGR04222 family)
MRPTWGISEPTFLAGYVVLGLVVWAATTRARHALAGGPDRPGPGPGQPHDLAILNDGADLAITCALTSMHLKGTVALSRGKAVAIGRPGAGTDGLERAVHAATGRRVRRHRLATTAPVRRELDAMERRLVADGLLLSGARRAAVRAVGWWTLVFAALGLAWLLWGAAWSGFVHPMIEIVIFAILLALYQLRSAPRRSRPGDRLLARLRSEHHALRPGSRPDWVVHGPAAAAVGIAVFGASALWASDPALAEELALQRASGGGDGASMEGGDGGSV